MLRPYPLKENDNSAYEFITKQGIKYIIYFLDYSYMFEDYPKIANSVYTFNIDVIEGNSNSASTDERIGVTVVEVIKQFFSKVQNVAVYVCDRADKRHLARKRKFDMWFWKYSDGAILKEDSMAVIEGVEILNTLLIHKDNKHLKEIILAYKELNDKASGK